MEKLLKDEFCFMNDINEYWELQEGENTEDWKCLIVDLHGYYCNILIL